MAAQGRDSEEPWDLEVDVQVIQVRRALPGSAGRQAHGVRSKAESLG